MAFPSGEIAAAPTECRSITWRNVGPGTGAVCAAAIPTIPKLKDTTPLHVRMSFPSPLLSERAVGKMITALGVSL
jgi:hypothetical protein